MNTASHARRQTIATAVKTALVGLLCAAMYLNQAWFLSSVDLSDDAALGEREALPPTLALVTIALGPIRGLIADLLWWRAIQLQDDGEYFEIIQLADWITAIQPRNTHVWAFQAWNMCYNIAYEFPDHEDRWRWIKRALDLLRHQALRANPGNPHVQAEITRILQDRIAKVGNVEHDLFMRKWAMAMMGALHRGDRAELAELAAMPASAEALRSDPEVAALLAAAGPSARALLTMAPWPPPEEWPTAWSQLSADPRHAAGWAKVDLWRRAGWLRTNQRLDLELAMRIDDEFGPFDWRLPQAQSVYWGAHANPRIAATMRVGFDQLVRQAMDNAIFHGRLLVDLEADILAMTPNLAMIGRVNDFYEDLLAEAGDGATLAPVHRLFLDRAVALLYSCDREAEARRLYEHLERRYDGYVPDFADFIADRFSHLMLWPRPQDRREAIAGALHQAYSWLAGGDPARAQGYAKFAALLYSRADDDDSLPAMAEMRQAAVSRLLAAGMAENYRWRLLQRIHSANLPPTDTSTPLYLGREVPPARAD